VDDPCSGAGPRFGDSVVDVSELHTQSLLWDSSEQEPIHPPGTHHSLRLKWPQSRRRKWKCKKTSGFWLPAVGVWIDPFVSVPWLMSFSFQATIRAITAKEHSFGRIPHRVKKRIEFWEYYRNLMGKPLPSTNSASFLLTEGVHCARHRGISREGSHARDPALGKNRSL
jgi:hypothetical protein